MNALTNILPILIVVVIEAYILNIDSPEDSVIDDIVVTGNETEFSAIILLKKNKDFTGEAFILAPKGKANEEIYLPGDEDDGEKEDNDKDDSDDDENITNQEPIDNLEIFLRRKPFKSCMKEGAKYCKKSCHTAVSYGCSYYGCESKLKKMLKKECSRSCKLNFSS